MEPVILEVPIPNSPILGVVVVLVGIFAVVRFFARWWDLVGV